MSETSRSSTSVWPKMLSLAATANLAGALVAMWVARWVRAIPASETSETGLLFTYYGAMLLVAVFDALLLDELLFQGTFRKTHLEGLSPERLGKRDDEVDAAASMRRTSMTFPTLVIACGVVTYLLFNQFNQGFDEYYRRIGRDIAQLHRGDTEQQVSAIQRLAILRKAHLARVMLELREASRSDDPEVARWATWGLGRLADQPQRRPLVAPLVAASRREHPLVRREALVGLGRIQHRSSAPAIQAEVRNLHDAGEPIDPRLLIALGYVQTMSSVELLDKLLHAGDETTQGLAAWALAQHRDQRGGREVVTTLEQRLVTASQPVRCDIVHALAILSDERSNLALMQAYDASSEAERQTVCRRLEQSMRPDGGRDDRVDLFMPEDTFAMKTIGAMAQMRATSPEIRQQVEPWLEAFIADPQTLPAPREGAKTLLTGIREGRNDDNAPSVDEALGLSASQAEL